MTDIDNRVYKLETRTSKFSEDLHDINNKVGHIESDMNELKTITKNNTSSNLKTNATLTDIHMTISGFKGGLTVVLWLIGSLGGLTGLIALITALGKLNGA